MASVYHYLIMTALGQQRPETLSEISRVCTQCGCNLLNIKINTHGNEIAMVLYLAGNWGAIAKIETAIPTLEQRLGLKLTAKRGTEAKQLGQAMVYSIQVTALDKPGIMQGLTSFFYQLSIPIEEISGHTYFTNTGTRMVSLSAKIYISDKVHLATLREQFMTHCDDNNLDAFLEPLRG